MLSLGTARLHFLLLLHVLQLLPVLTSIFQVRSVLSPGHPCAREDVGTIAAGKTDSEVRSVAERDLWMPCARFSCCMRIELKDWQRKPRANGCDGLVRSGTSSLVFSSEMNVNDCMCIAGHRSVTPPCVLGPDHQLARSERFALWTVSARKREHQHHVCPPLDSIADMDMSDWSSSVSGSRSAFTRKGTSVITGEHWCEGADEE
jgi:hypothetical protein